MAQWWSIEVFHSEAMALPEPDADKRVDLTAVAPPGLLDPAGTAPG